MGTAVRETNEPQGASLDDAASRVMGLLSDDPSEESAATSSQPEPDQKKKKEPAASDPKLASAAPDESEETPVAESEQATDTESAETDEESPPAPRMHTIRVNGQDIEVAEDELHAGYSRTQDYTRKTQQLAQDRKAWEEKEVAAVRAERREYSELLGQLKTAVESLHPKEPDWETLRATVSPDVFAQEWSSWTATQKRAAQIKAEQDRVAAQEKADAENGFTSYLREQRELLVSKLPDFGDTEKAKTLDKDLMATAESLGFTPDEYSKVADHRLYVLLHKAMLFDRGQAKAPKIEQKIENAIKPAKPGGSSSNNPKPNKLAAAKQRLRQTGSLDDGAAAIAHLLE